ncbi:MAG: CopG family transcriptional regulator [Fibrobacteres bacterium]|nr:CopG family transcriptional regulator [Fibrobacterota bacterium]
MHKTVTLRLDESNYNIFKLLASRENRPISNFIETATMRYVQSTEYADEFEMAEINQNKALNESLKRGLSDAKKNKGRFV